MSNQFENQYLLNSNSSSIINGNDNNNLIRSQQHPPVQIDQSIKTLNINNTLTSTNQLNVLNNINREDINNINNNANYSNINQQINSSGQQANMSQTAQIVLLPTQNINLINNIANVPKQEHIQMILPNDVSYQLRFSNVLVPTTILFNNNECILNICPSVPLASTTNQMITVSADLSPACVEYETNCPQQQQQEFNSDQECEFITLANTATQTVIADLSENEIDQTTQLLANNCQILGIIGNNQIGILQNETDPENQVLLAACIETPVEAVVDNDAVEQLAATASTTDINTFLASTLSDDEIEKFDSNHAKEWLKDSCIVNRALKALKKVNHQRSTSQT